VPRQASTFVDNSFVKGLITEATGLNFPEQAVTATDNCVFDERGLVRRRYGIDLEEDFDTVTVSVTSKATTVYLWEGAAGSGDNTIVVVQIGKVLYFYLVDDNVVSDDQFASFDIETFRPSGSSADVGSVECQFDAGKGFLFVANPFTESFYVEFDPDTNTIDETAITIRVRDFEGVDDGLRIDERPATLSESHEYNLLNQGWDTYLLEISGGTQDYALHEWDDTWPDFPSNCDVWWRYYESGNNLQFGVNLEPGNSPAPKGFYIFDYYDQDRNSVDPKDSSRSITGVTTRTSGDNRASTIAFFAGRVWYGGTSGEGYSNTVLFSQIIERDSQIGECYQQNDPTSQYLFDLLPTDGGTILIPDSGTIVKLFAFEDSLLIFATNGVWRVSGSEGLGFRATDYSVTKVSSISCLTASSFVSIAGVPSFWNREGIYVLNTDKALGSTSISSITDNTIRGFYNTIPYESRKYVHGFYNRTTHVLSWIYRTTAPTTTTQNYSYNAVLNFNTLSGAFYGWTVDITNVTIKGVIVPAENTKFFVSYSGVVTFADERSESYIDWFSFNSVGVGYTSSFTSGYKVHGDGQRKTQPTYINLFFDTSDDDSSLDFRSIWQYANTGTTGRWSSAQRITTTSNDYDYTRRRIKSRGSGIVYQFNVTSVSGQPFFLIGWSVFETANANL
jgi:hypothetical protein